MHQFSDKDKNSIDIIFKNRYQIVFDDLDRIDNGWKDPTNEEGVYSDDGDAEDSNGDTSEDSDYNPNEDKDYGISAAEDNTDNQQIENTNEGVHETEVHGDPGLDTNYNPDPDKTSVDEPGA